MATTTESPGTANSAYDRISELKAFDNSKAGVKGLVDEGVSEIPQMFIHPPDIFEKNSQTTRTHVGVPVIDLECIHTDPIRRKEIVNELLDVSEKWGFYQVINHGIPVNVLEEMVSGVRRFYEQDIEVKKEFYSRDTSKKVVYNSNFDLFTAPAANWRDSFYCLMAPTPPNPEDIPAVCREILLEYSKQVTKLGSTLLEMTSEALGLNPNHLKDIGCTDGLITICHYYPECPQPELTLGTTKHADDDFITVLLQDEVGGLQVLHQNEWVDVPPVPGALVINVGYLMQLITNDKFKSVEHRVLANHVAPRISVACFFSTSFQPSSRIFRPIKELCSEENPPKYKETTIIDFVTHVFQKGLDGTSTLSHLEIQT